MGAAALAGAAGSLTGCGSSGQGDGKATIIRVAFNQPETHAEYIALADFGEKFAACVMVFGGSIITRMQMVSLDSSLHIPMGVVYAVIPVCGVITVFHCICNILKELEKAKEAA